MLVGQTVSGLRYSRPSMQKLGDDRGNRLSLAGRWLFIDHSWSIKCNNTGCVLQVTADELGDYEASEDLMVVACLPFAIALEADKQTGTAFALLVQALIFYTKVFVSHASLIAT